MELRIGINVGDARRGHITGSAGDSVLAEFASIVDAVNCGVAIQQAPRRVRSCRPLRRSARGQWLRACQRLMSEPDNVLLFGSTNQLWSSEFGLRNCQVLR